jgi:uncharacterized protein (TIGR02147 family)
MKTRPDAFAYTDFRQFLLDLAEWKRGEASGFSLRQWSKLAGLGSSGTLSKILQGSKVRSETLHSICEAALLNDREIQHVLGLAAFNQAETHDARSAAFARLQRAAPLSAITQDSSSLRLYAKWYHVAILELLHFKPFSGNYSLLAAQLDPPITPAEAQESMQLLQELALVHKTAQGIRRAHNASLTTGPHVQSLAVDTFQMATLDLSRRAVQQIPRPSRNISTLTFSLAQADFALLEEEVRNFRKTLLRLAKQSKKEDTVYQVNIQMFPLTRKTSPGKL